jgi:hypothetical protein
MGFGALGLAALCGEGIFLKEARAGESSADRCTPNRRTSPPRPNMSSTSSPKVRRRTLTLGIPNRHSPNLMENPSPARTAWPWRRRSSSRRKANPASRSAKCFPNSAKSWMILCIVRSCHTDIPAHEVATVFMNTGSHAKRDRASVRGCFTVWARENQNMPGYISLRPGGPPPGGSANWQSAFLPGQYQGVSINTRSPPWIS